MIDITDESYESDLTEEESVALLLSSEHAIAPPLSPAAQAVLDAVLHVSNLSSTISGAAAALRAAAYQVAPAKPVLDSCCDRYEQTMRHKLLAIAAELEGQ